MSSQSIQRIIKRNGNIENYNRSLISSAIFKAAKAVGINDPVMAEALAIQVEKSLISMSGDSSVPSVEEIQDIVENILIKNGQVKIARAYIIYRYERAKLRAELIQRGDNIPYKKIYDVLKWNIQHECHTISEINETIAKGEFADLVQATDSRYEKEVMLGAAKIIKNLPKVRLVIVAGPSSSGKTTTTIKLGEKLKQEGVEFVSLALDNYFFGLDYQPKDEFGDYDYEAPTALDLDLINSHLVQLLDNKTIKTPVYDFKTGVRKLDVHEMKLEKHQILLIDCLHGLYEPMTKSVPKNKKFKLYIETLGQVRDEEGNFMRWSDNRLMRRMVRDSWHRNLKPVETLTHWHYVRRSELRNIIPHISKVDYLINSALPYELPILKNRLAKIFPDAISEFQDNPKRKDAYIRAKRVYNFLASMTEIADDSALSKTSLIREFIGGSDYKY